MAPKRNAPPQRSTSAPEYRPIVGSYGSGRFARPRRQGDAPHQPPPEEPKPVMVVDPSVPLPKGFDPDYYARDDWYECAPDPDNEIGPHELSEIFGYGHR